MHFCHMKRCVSLVLALVMVFSLMPLHGFAAGADHHDHPEESALQEQADALVLEYLGGAAMTDDQIRAAVDAMDPLSLCQAADEIRAMIEPLRLLTEEELLRFAAENPAFAVFSERGMAAEPYDTMIADSADIMPMATSGTVLSGQITVTDTAGNVMLEYL